MTLLEIDALDAEIGGTPVLRNVSLRIGAGEFVGLIGPNGAGKSTLLRAVAGLRNASGRIRIGGQPAEELSSRQRGCRVAYLPQEREIAWPVSVARLVALGRSPHIPPFGAASEADREAIRSAMQRMDVEWLAQRPATDLSGGEKARVLIARALAQEAPLLLADEPTAGLDPSHQISLMRLFSRLGEEGRSVIACLHDLGLAARWCTRLVLIDRGTIVADGTPEAVLTPQNMRDVYGVEAYLSRHGGRPLVQPVDIAEPDEA